MSYILEALKKADAAREREREAVPGLHSRHDHALPDDADERSEQVPAARAPWLVGGIAGGVVIAGALFWLLGRSGPNAPPTGETRPMPLHGQVSEAPAHAPNPPAVTATSPAAPAPRPVEQVQSPAPVQALPTPSERQAKVAPNPPITSPAPPAPAATPAPPPTARAVRPAPDPLRVDSSLRESGPKVVTMQELPDDIRRELPQLSVGGAMHSDVAANRMLVLNGGVYREGDQPAPGVVLEEIRLKSAVLRYKGHRYSISY